MNSIVVHILRFLFFVLIQVLVLNQLEVGFGVQIMVYPLYILLLPVEMNVFPLMFLAFGMGLAIDSMSNTYGLHTSSLIAVAYFRPVFFKLFAPRDGYDIFLETNVFNMGFSWFLRTFGALLLLHHVWFFTLEMFKLNEILMILQKTTFSVVISFLICILLQYLFIRNKKENEVR